jgi:hypothetical protein
MDNNQKIGAVISIFLATIILCGGAGFLGYFYGSHTEYQAIYNQGYAQGKDAGYDDGYKSGYEARLKPSPEQQTSVSDILQNPTYQEMKLFLAQDTTNSNNYEEDMYVCTDFAVAVNNNAESQGIRCAIVDMFYPDGYGHTIVAFETTDRGLIFIEPQFDREVEMVIGESYSKSNKFTAAPRDDTINRYLIAW